MKELKFLEIIKDRLADSSYIGNDCAFLEDLNIYVTQDTLIEDVHFSMHFITPYLLGRKAVSVNLSDLAAALSKPLYITVSLSMPKLIEESFVSELYRGINEVCSEYGVKVIGGDITGGSKIVISICAIGKKVSKYSASRNAAQKDDYIIAAGNFGASAAGFYALSNFLQAEAALISAHLNPEPKIKEGLAAAAALERDAAAMDASDGFCDALYKIAAASGRSLYADMTKVPVLKEVKEYCARNKLDFQNFVKWGGEDYALILCVNKETYMKLDSSIFTCIGRVQNKESEPAVLLDFGSRQEIITRKVFENNSFNHF